MDDSSFIAERCPPSSARRRSRSRHRAAAAAAGRRPDDRELLDALFRCAHTVKGSAGIFGLDAVVAFTHHVETCSTGCAKASSR
jgi:two-component system chemotaxis sensor kinase CheA